jgi:hypothetical protein
MVRAPDARQVPHRVKDGHGEKQAADDTHRIYENVRHDNAIEIYAVVLKKAERED